MSLIEQIPGVGPYLPYVTLVMAVASLLAAAMPPPTTTSGSVYVTVYNLVHLAAANVGNAKAASAYILAHLAAANVGNAKAASAPQGNPK